MTIRRVPGITKQRPGMTAPAAVFNSVSICYLCECFVKCCCQSISVNSVNLSCCLDRLALGCRASDAHHAVCKECAYQFRVLTDNITDDHVLSNHFNSPFITAGTAVQLSVKSRISVNARYVPTHIVQPQEMVVKQNPICPVGNHAAHHRRPNMDPAA